jgi:hypothetical protein
MSRLTVPRILATGSIVSAATSVRAGVGFAELVARRVPRLVGLALQSTAGTQPAAKQSAFRDELLGLARESAELSWRELRRGVDTLDLYTRSGSESGPRRPYRVKP